MAEGLNKVMLLGNLGADPELKMTQSGQAVLKLRLATTETYLDKNQTRQERTEWHSVTLWGKRGEALAKFLTKGERIFVEGSLRTSSYEKNGEKRYSTEIN
ncbi:MAG TPA: single-stranded DNA-binding protein, partial [Labilithrix sp.]|nr:single-stranded DNA-binding protein [Labilithrix sp.]